MASRPPVAVYDACVLYPFHLRNVLVQCAADGLVAARWTDDIHDEWIRNLVSPTLSRAKLEITRDLMIAFVPNADVKDHRPLIPGLILPDPDDRHVLAAAIAGKASFIVTSNLKHFPAAALKTHGVTALSPDDFLAQLYRNEPEALIDSVAIARRNLQRTRPTADDFIETLKRQNLPAFCAILDRHKRKI